MRWYFYIQKGIEVMKVWKDANEIGMIHDMPNEKLKELDIEMRKKPKFDKIKEGEKEWIKNGKKKNKMCIKTYKKRKRRKKNDSVSGSK